MVDFVYRQIVVMDSDTNQAFFDSRYEPSRRNIPVLMAKCYLLIFFFRGADIAFLSLE